MNYARALELFWNTSSAATLPAIVQAMPDSRLTHPVGDYGFPGREFDPRHCWSASIALACSGLRPVRPVEI